MRAPGRLVYLKFYDHFSDSEVEDIRRLEPVIVEAVGWVIREDERYIYISSWISHDGKEDAYDIYGIFKQAIIEMKELTPKTITVSVLPQ